MKIFIILLFSICTLFSKNICDVSAGGSDSGVSYKFEFPNSIWRCIADKEYEDVSVEDFGVVGDGVKDNTDKINKALISVQLAKVGLKFPSGKYKTRGGHVITNNISIKGAGKGLTIIEYDQANKAGCLFIKGAETSGNILDYVTFSDMTVNGTWATTQNEINEASCFDIYYVRHLKYQNIAITNNCFMGFKGNYCYEVEADGCNVEKSTRDAFNFENCSNVKISNWDVKWCADDAIASHMSDLAGIPIRNSISITNGTMQDCIGIDIMGAKTVTITGVTGKLLRGKGIKVGFDTNYDEGLTSQYGITITGNTLTDVIHAGFFNPGYTEHSWILLESYPPSTGGTLANIPLLNNSSTGAIINYLSYLNTNGLNASTPQAGGFFINVTGNILIRTLPNATNYSDLGYGNYFAKTGFKDGAFTHVADSGDIDTDTQDGIGIKLASSARNFNISNNTVSTGNVGIRFIKSALASNDFFFWNGKIVNNQFFRQRGGGIGNNFTADTYVNISIINNLLDIDPCFESSRRTSGGTWNTGLTTPFAIDLSCMKGVQLGGNEYANCIQMVKTSENTLVNYVAPEIPHCKPVATGKSNLNIGIGTCPSAAQGKYHYVIVEGNPTSSDYGKILNTCEVDGAVCPTTGIYVAGHFVKNNAPAIANGAVTLGWIRLTTGGEHVAGTDWAIIGGTSQ